MYKTNNAPSHRPFYQWEIHEKATLTTLSALTALGIIASLSLAFHRGGHYGSLFSYTPLVATSSFTVISATSLIFFSIYASRKSSVFPVTDAVTIKAPDLLTTQKASGASPVSQEEEVSTCAISDSSATPPLPIDGKEKLAQVQRELATALEKAGSKEEARKIFSDTVINHGCQTLETFIRTYTQSVMTLNEERPKFVRPIEDYEKATNDAIGGLRRDVEEHMNKSPAELKAFLGDLLQTSYNDSDLGCRIPKDRFTELLAACDQVETLEGYKKYLQICATHVQDFFGILMFLIIWKEIHIHNKDHPGKYKKFHRAVQENESFLPEGHVVSTRRIVSTNIMLTKLNRYFPFVSVKKTTTFNPLSPIPFTRHITDLIFCFYSLIRVLIHPKPGKQAVFKAFFHKEIAHFVNKLDASIDPGPQKLTEIRPCNVHEYNFMAFMIDFTDKLRTFTAE